MEIKQALETILSEVVSLSKKAEIRESLKKTVALRFYFPLHNVQAAKSYLIAGLPEANVVASQLYRDAFNQLYLPIDKKIHRDLSYLVRQLSFHGFVKYDDPSSYATHIQGAKSKKMNLIYGRLSEAHKFIVDYYLSELMVDVQQLRVQQNQFQ